MAKATIQSVIDMGFTAEQFGDPAGFDQAAGYVDTVLSNMGLVVADAVGASVYDAAANLDLYRIEEAEKYLTAAELMRRLVNFEQAKMHKSRSAEAVELENQRILKRAELADKTAAMHLQALGVDTDGALAAGHNTQDPFEVSA